MLEDIELVNVRKKEAIKRLREWLEVSDDLKEHEELQFAIGKLESPSFSEEGMYSLEDIVWRRKKRYLTENEIRKLISCFIEEALNGSCVVFGYFMENMKEREGEK